MLSQKMKNVTPSYTIGISTKVKALREQGETIIDLSIGEPDFFTPENAKKAGIEAIQNNHTKYDVVAGLMPLRQAICQKLATENKAHYTPSDIVVSSGAKNAITNALMVLLDPGDEVIIPVPYWTSYPEMVKLCGGQPIFAQTSEADQFKLTLETLKATISPKTKALLINNPSNPTGAIYTREELMPLLEYCIANEIYIIADEIYERIHYTEDFVSIPSLSEEIKALTILINGHSKSVSMTGWRLGYTASSPEIAKAMSMIQGHLISHPSLITQYAGLGALTQCEADITHMVATYTHRRNVLIERLDKIDHISYIKPDGAFYLFINISALKDAIKGESLSLAFCDTLLADYKVAAVPGIAFGKDEYIRLSYATELDFVLKGLDLIESFIQETLKA